MERIESAISSKLVNEIMKDPEFKRIRACIQCGECTAGCPSGLYTSLRIRKVMRKTLIGIENLLSVDDIWECACCYNCLERCTRHIPVTEVIYRLRNMAVRNGYLLEPFKVFIKNFIETGQSVPIGGPHSKWMYLRQLLDLGPVPHATDLSVKARKELDQILYQIKLSQRIPYFKE